MRYGNRIAKTIQYTAYYGHQENPPNGTNTDNTGRCTGIDGTAHPVKVGGKSTTPYPGKTGVKNLGTQHCQVQHTRGWNDLDGAGGKVDVRGATRGMDSPGLGLYRPPLAEVFLTNRNLQPLSTSLTTHNPAVTAPTFRIISNGCAASGMTPVVAFHVLGQHKGAQVRPSAFPSSTLNRRSACLATIIDAHTALPEYKKYGGGK
ncbi:hypothetical protein C8F01DRAFT_1075439 [Mycena amicta]|nr:hypothetical protein C8F01DRAFT_1075439 [Mycena amicta]